MGSAGDHRQTSEVFMEPISPVPSPEAIALLSAVLRSVAIRRLGPDDAADFIQSAELRVLQRRYDVLTRFDGRSSLRTYLHVVVERLLIDWRNAEYGKWRPSAPARRLGPIGVFIDRLIWRDGYSGAEAVETTRSRWPHVPVASLVELVDQLPPHRPRLVHRELGDDVAITDFDDPVVRRETEQATRRRRKALLGALRTLLQDDRAILRARYVEGRSVRAIAEAAGLDPKALYRRFDRLLLRLRRMVAEQVDDRSLASIGSGLMGHQSSGLSAGRDNAALNPAEIGGAVI
jgi:RNA polymerase sigma factor for flagellar operon FliA